MNAEEIRERAKTSPEWLFVELVNRIATLEKQVAELSAKRGPGRPKKVKSGAVDVYRTASRS